MDPPKSVAGHSVDAVAPPGGQSVTRTAGGQSVVISGKAMDCFRPVPGQPLEPYPVTTLPVKGFDPASNGNLVAVLRSMDTLGKSFALNDNAGIKRWNSDYDQLKSLFTTATALGVDSTSSTGSYSLTVPSMDSVLVLGFTEREDEDSYFRYQMVGARSNVSLLLDMRWGGCPALIDMKQRSDRK
jgi:hypothetical protein